MMLDNVRNPFRTAYMQTNFYTALKHYDEKGRAFFYPNGKRCIGSAWAHRFWQGFDRVELDWGSDRDTAAYAMYKAGKAIRNQITRIDAQLEDSGVGHGYHRRARST